MTNTKQKPLATKKNQKRDVERAGLKIWDAVLR